MLGNSFENAKDAPLFSYRANPVHERGFQILKRNEPVGEYLILDKKEGRALSEKKIINLISLLNGKDVLTVPQEDLEGRLLYSSLPSEDHRNKIMFYKYTGKGVSVENALLMINKEDLPNV